MPVTSSSELILFALLDVKLLKEFTILSILKLLKNEGYYLGDDSLPREPKELMRLLLSHRTNSEDTNSNPALAYLSLDQYLKYWED